VGDAPERPQVLDGRRVPVPELVGSASTNRLAGGPVQQINRRRHYLSPEHSRERLGLHHAPGCAHHSLVVALDDTVLLRRVWCRELLANSELGEVVDEVSRGELSSTISAQHEQLLATLAFCRGLNVLDGGGRGVLGRQ